MSRFSSRVPQSLEPNALTRALRAARARAGELLDLTVSNPTTAGFVYPEALLDALRSPAGLVYEPAPQGHLAAREAIAREYARRGDAVPADRIVLTASTSEAYSVLFKLLCDPADEVLTPAPSYPLFEHLTRLDGVSPVTYRLEHHGRWSIDFDDLAAVWTPRTRAVLAVSPNNPTGSCLSREEADALVAACASRGAALIVDEVFADYPLELPVSEPVLSRGPAECLTFRLGGLSKSAGLPQVKLGWIAVDGPAAALEVATGRLEFICDAYLSVSTPVQLAAPRLIEDGAVVRRQIAERVCRNYGRLRQACADHPAVDVLHAEAGWSAILRVPALATEEALVLDLLERDSVLVHPGFFFDFASEAFVVVSLLAPPAAFDEGIARLLRRLAQ